MKRIRILDFIRRHRERGMVLVVALLVSVVMFALVTPFMSRLSGGYRSTEMAFRDLAALNLAEAGIERAIWELNSGDISAWSGSTSARTLTLTGVQTPAGDAVGNIDVTVINPSSDNPIVLSQGSVAWTGSQSVTRTVRVVLKHGFQSFFNYGIFGDEGFDLSGNAYIDSYNSLNGPYDPQNPGNLGNVGTNADGQWDVVLLNNTVVYGDAYTGFESDPDEVIRLRNRATITGITAALDEPVLLPAPPAPFLPDRGAITIVGNTTDTVISESGSYSGFIMNANSKITITGDVTMYIDGNFLMESNAVIEIAEGASLELIMGDGTFIQRSNTQVNNLSQDPKALAILGTADFHYMEWRANSELWGVIYVPEALIDFESNSNVYGSMVGNYLSLSSNAGIHYDESLGGWDQYGVESATYLVKSWQELI